MIMGFIRKQFLDVIQSENSDENTLVSMPKRSNAIDFPYSFCHIRLRTNQAHIFVPHLPFPGGHQLYYVYGLPCAPAVRRVVDDKGESCAHV